MRIHDELRKLLANIFIDNAKLRKQVNSLVKHRLNTGIMSGNNNTESSESLERRNEN